MYGFLSGVPIPGRGGALGMPPMETIIVQNSHVIADQVKEEDQVYHPVMEEAVEPQEYQIYLLSHCCSGCLHFYLCNDE